MRDQLLGVLDRSIHKFDLGPSPSRLGDGHHSAARVPTVRFLIADWALALSC